MARSNWHVDVEGNTQMVVAGRIHTALKEALRHHPMPPMGQCTVIKVWRVGAVAPRKLGRR